MYQRQPSEWTEDTAIRQIEYGGPIRTDAASMAAWLWLKAWVAYLHVSAATSARNAAEARAK